MPESLASMSNSSILHPPIEWAQRKEVIFLTIAIDDCKVETLSVDDDKLVFKGKGGAEHHVYEGTITFFEDVVGKDYRRIPSDRNIQLVLPKKKAGQFWPRLTKEKQKCHWIKVDFGKWKDEDEDSDTEKGAENGFDLNSMMGQMGGGMDFDKPDLDDFEDSDNEDLPDLEDDTPNEADGEKAEKAQSSEKGEGDGKKEEEKEAAEKKE